MVERVPEEHGVGGSIPPSGTYDQTKQYAQQQFKTKHTNQFARS